MVDCDIEYAIRRGVVLRWVDLNGGQRAIKYYWKGNTALKFVAIGGHYEREWLARCHINKARGEEVNLILDKGRTEITIELRVHPLQSECIKVINSMDENEVVTLRQLIN